MKILSIDDVNIEDKKVLLRVDFNVPLNKDGEIADDMRIKSSLATIKKLLEGNNSIIIMSHLGRPKGKKEKSLSLKPCVEKLEELLHQKVYFITDTIGEKVSTAVKNLKPKEILVLENLRFYDAETDSENSASFAKKLAAFGDVYVNDAFATAHRKHASTYFLPKLFEKKALAGKLLKNEIIHLTNLLEKPKRPFFAILGGSKISSKTGVILSLLDVVDEIFIGGGMAYTFFLYQGKKIGKSICEKKELPTIEKIFKKAEKRNIKINLPIDLVIAGDISENAQTKIISTDEDIPNNFEGVDIGPKTIEYFENKIKDAKTIFQNGPLGIFEIQKFSKGTFAILNAIAKSKATTIIGGGDTALAVKMLGISDKITHVSTGGGASLEFIENKTLPGIEVLSKK